MHLYIASFESKEFFFKFKMQNFYFNIKVLFKSYIYYTLHTLGFDAFDSKVNHELNQKRAWYWISILTAFYIAGV